MDTGMSQATGDPIERADRQRHSRGLTFTKRRSFLGMLLGIGTVGVGALLSVPLIRFAFYPALAKTTETEWSDLGPVEEFASITGPVKRVITIEQLDGWRKSTSEKSVYVTKGTDGSMRVLSSVCPHLGCTVSWNEAKGQFICPCHIGVFKTDGALVSGPPRRSMDELQSRVADGHLLARYQYFRPLVATKEVIA